MPSVRAARFLFHPTASITRRMYSFSTSSSVRSVDIGTGTLYGALSTLQKEGLIHKVHEGNRRKSYTLTPKGKRVLQGQIRRLEIMTREGAKVIGGSC